MEIKDEKLIMAILLKTNNSKGQNKNRTRDQNWEINKKRMALKKDTRQSTKMTATTQSIILIELGSVTNLCCLLVPLESPKYHLHFFFGNRQFLFLLRLKQVSSTFSNRVLVFSSFISFLGSSVGWIHKQSFIIKMR